MYCIDKLIHSDQSGFLKGRTIGNNICLLFDVMDYTDILMIFLVPFFFLRFLTV